MARAQKSRPRDRYRGVRREGTRQPRTELFFAVEGKTEEQYIRSLLDTRYKDRFAPTFLPKVGSRRYTKTSLINLIDAARNEERTWSRRDRRLIWIICDVDENSVHDDVLQQWLNASPTLHFVALQSVSIEAWFLQHMDKATRVTSNDQALRELKKQWSDYSKGCAIPPWLIRRTDRACQRERQFIGQSPERGSWPKNGSSQLHMLIGALDDLANPES